jgi:hypothetical protein
MYWYSSPSTPSILSLLKTSASMYQYHSYHGSTRGQRKANSQWPTATSNKIANQNARYGNIFPSFPLAIAIASLIALYQTAKEAYAMRRSKVCSHGGVEVSGREPPEPCLRRLDWARREGTVSPVE